MDDLDLLAATERDGAAFADACRGAGLDAPVPPCPEWDVADLLWHLTDVHSFWGTVVREQRTSLDGLDEPQRPADDQLMALFEDQFGALLAVLRSTDRDVPVWSWSGGRRDVGWVVRRMAHETAVHRWDAEAAVGAPTPIESPLASDGIDEFLEHFLPWAAEGASPVGGTVHLHCTDTPGEWLVVPAGDGFTVTREHAKGDCALRGAAGDLLLALWRRVPLDAIDVVGDAEVAARFVARTRLS